MAAVRPMPRYFIGGTAMAVSLVLPFLKPGDAKLAMGCGFFLASCGTDTLSSRIPNLLNLALLLTGFAYNYHLQGASGCVSALAGAAFGFGFLLIPYLLGGTGGGDVKALAALGALLGPWEILQVFLYGAVFGGVMSIVHYACAHDLRRKLGEWRQALGAFAASGQATCLRPTDAAKLRFPYIAAFAFGYFAHIQWGGPL